MSTYSATIAAGGAWEHNGNGNFLRIIEATAEVNIRYYLAGREVAEASGMLAGYAETFDGEGFDRVRIEAPDGATFKVVIRAGSKVSYDRGAANVDVASLPDIKIAAGQSVAVESLPDVTVNPAMIGSLSSGCWGNAGTYTLISPGANTGGAVVMSGWINGYSGNQAGLVCDTAMPTDAKFNSGELPVLVVDSGNFQNITREFFVPAGYGLYLAPIIGGSSVAGAISYELL